MTDAIETEFKNCKQEELITFILNVLADNGTRSLEIYKKGSHCFARQWLVDRDDSMYTVVNEADI